MLRRDSDRRRSSRKAQRASGDGSPGARNGRNRKRSGGEPRAESFVLYVEGARDREILECWARRVDSGMARLVETRAVILGGRRPARAASDFRKRGGASAGLTGLVVLDRDDHDASTASVDEDGLELFVWRRRHIESYLLVPAALRRLVGLDPDDRRIERLVEQDAQGPDALHAKRILGAGGSLSEVLGRELRAGEIARAMRREDLHDDVLELFERIARVSGLARVGPEVVIRPRTRS